MKSNINEKIVQKIKEGVENIKEALPAGQPKSTKVVFDKSTNPYEVIFSERGFEVEGERFSFEFIETAASKNLNIVLDNGKGLVLDKIKMAKILKYKDLY
jgi:hypothetical protein